MLRGRGPVLILVSLLLAGAAAWVANNWVVARTTIADPLSPGTTPVLSAAMEIPFGTRIEARHVQVIQMLPGTAPRGALTKFEDVAGHVSRASILRGEILFGERFAKAGEGSTLAAVVTDNMRAVTVRVDDVAGVAGFLLPGNRVDVISAYSEDRDTKSETVLENVKVLAVDQTSATDKSEPLVVRAVTLEVTPKDAEVLVRAKQRGSILLSLRNPMDDTLREKPKPVAAPVKTGPPPAAPGVTIIRGTDVGREVLKSVGR